MFAPQLFVFFPAFFVSICLTISLSHVASMVLPVDIYFSFKSFLFDTDNKFRYLALIIKLAIPFISGFGVTIIFANWSAPHDREISMDRRLTFYQFARDNLSLTFFVSGAFAAALQAWPAIVFWDFVADPQVVDLKFLFYGVYCIYFVSYGYFTLAGAYAALTVLGKRNDLSIPGSEALKSLGKSARSGILGFITSGIGSLVLEYAKIAIK